MRYNKNAMKHLQKAWNNFKAQPEMWFFYGFLLTSMLSVRKVIADYFIAGSFNEYSGAYIYLSDLFLVATLVVWIISILNNKNTRLSIYNWLIVSRGTFYALGIFLVWVLLTVGWTGRPEIGYFKFFKLFELGLLFLFLSLNEKCSSWNILKNIFKMVIFIGFINALIGIFQFIFQHSIGLFWLKESLISPDFPGVAKIILNGQKYVRVYGLFPHPNILGGFLLLSIILTLAYGKWNVPRLPRETKMFHGELFSFLRGETFLWLIFGIQIVGLFLTFSKSAILGLILAVGYIFYRNKTNVPRGTFKKALFLGLILLLLIYIINPNLNVFFFKSLNERLLFLEAAKNMILAHPLLGVGLGQFVPQMQSYLPVELLDWQFQPAHNVFLLIWAELGLVGLVIFCWFIYKLFRAHKNVPRGTIDSHKNLSGLFKAILAGFLFIALFDHYFWDIQQGQIMFWIVLGILNGVKLLTLQQRSLHFSNKKVS